MFLNYMGKMVRAGVGIFDKLEPEPHKNELSPQHCFRNCEENGSCFFAVCYRFCRQNHHLLIFIRSFFWFFSNEGLSAAAESGPLRILSVTGNSSLVASSSLQQDNDVDRRRRHSAAATAATKTNWPEQLETSVNNKAKLEDNPTVRHCCQIPSF
jgi:hypothetical protein